MTNEISEFRSQLAKNGFKCSLKKAEKMLLASKKFIDFMDKKQILEPQWFQELAEMSLEDKKRVCREMANVGKEATPNEITELIEFILKYNE